MTKREYRPDAHGIGHIHLGLGAFHRAHQADYTDAALAEEGGDWRILGVSLRSRETVDALNQQAGRYMMVIRDGSTPLYRQIRSIAGGLTGLDGTAPIIDALARDKTKVISLTVTEKAYQSGSELVDLLVEGLFARFQRNSSPVTIMSCDNLSDNGEVLKNALIRASVGKGEEAPSGILDWIESALMFPSTMVDRITPASDKALEHEMQQVLGRADPAAVQTEAFSQWVIEDRFAAGRPAWEAAGALMVSDVRPYEEMKLRMLNGAHSLLAYMGVLSGCECVRDVMAVPALKRLVERHMTAAAATLSPLPEVDFEDYAASLIKRFCNTAIAHRTEQIAMDGSQKLPQRWFEPALLALEGGQDLRPFSFASAIWLRYLTGQDDAACRYPIHDPRDAALMRAAEILDPLDCVRTMFALDGLVSVKLAQSDTFTNQVAEILQKLRKNGVGATLRDELPHF